MTGDDGPSCDNIAPRSLRDEEADGEDNEGHNVSLLAAETEEANVAAAVDGALVAIVVIVDAPILSEMSDAISLAFLDSRWKDCWN